jgi:hypothetical protein
MQYAAMQGMLVGLGEPITRGSLSFEDLSSQFVSESETGMQAGRRKVRRSTGVHLCE